MHRFFISKKKNDITVTNAFQKILNEFDRKPNKIWVNKCREIYKKSMKIRSKDNNIENHSMRENLLLPKDLSELRKAKYINIELLFQYQVRQ